MTCIFLYHRYDGSIINLDMHLNKYEIIGVFASVGIMALALLLLRLESTPSSVASLIDSSSQSAVVVANTDVQNGTGALADTLADAVTVDGELRDLVIDDIKIGTGPAVADGDTVSVHYIGTTQAGVQFDNSYTRGEPFTFTVGDGKVIAGWEKGIVGMQVGGQRILVIPAALAYGNRQVGPIPPGSPLVFAIELLEIK